MKLPVLAWLALTLLGAAQAQVAVPQPAASQEAIGAPQSVAQWLMHLHEAARQRAYVGTFVVTAGSYMSSARIWHVCEGAQQIERVESLTGVPRTTYRRNDEVMTYLPGNRVVVAEKRAALGLFPNLLNQADASIAQFYQLKPLGRDRVAGLLADVVQLVPRDSWRLGYRVWTEQATGLVIKLQTLDPAQTVLEQAAFSELKLAQPVSWAKLAAMMDNTEGYVVKKKELVRTTADQEGWLFKVGVPGFNPVSCHRHQEGAMAANGGSLQCVFSDGLASVSMFIEAFDAARHSKPQRHDSFAMGATHMQTRRVGDWWVSAVGEVPQQTLQSFAQGLERKK